MNDTINEVRNTGIPGQTARRIRKKRKGRKKRMGKRMKLFILSALLVLILLLSAAGIRVYKKYLYIGEKQLSEQVLAYKDLVEKYASEQGIDEYLEYLLAIMQVESGGQGKDVMQSSESAELPPNTLEPEESIKQACIYFKELLGYKERYGVDLDSVIQAYNYGPLYMRYVRDNGGKHTAKLAESYAEEKSGGIRKTYRNAIAIRANGGWRYAYGNMFYVELVKQYIG